MARNKKHDLKILTNKILRVINESSNKAVKEQLFPPGSTGTTTGTAVWADPSGWEQSIACKLNGACTNTGLPHQNPCNFLQKRYNANYSDLASLVANTMGGGATGTGTNPLWQNQLAYKLFHLFNIGLMNSYGIFCFISTGPNEGLIKEQRSGFDKSILALLTDDQITRAERVAEETAQSYAEAMRKVNMGDDGEDIFNDMDDSDDIMPKMPQITPGGDMAASVGAGALNMPTNPMDNPFMAANQGSMLNTTMMENLINEQYSDNPWMNFFYGSTGAAGTTPFVNPAGDFAGDAGGWMASNSAFGMWAMNQENILSIHNNPCRYIGKKMNNLNNKLSAMNPNPNWTAMVNMKLAYYTNKFSVLSCI